MKNSEDYEAGLEEVSARLHELENLTHELENLTDDHKLKLEMLEGQQEDLLRVIEKLELCVETRPESI